jgi:hypothetical protein
MLIFGGGGREREYGNYKQHFTSYRFTFVTFGFFGIGNTDMGASELPWWVRN